MGTNELGVGVIGCGGFGLFALQHFTQVPGLALRAMAGTHREAAYAASRRFAIPEPLEVAEMVARDDVDLVYISTPPFLHYDQAMAALGQGKHVICEKPLAMNLREADEMVSLAREKGLLLIANLMQRYNPLYDRIKELISSEALGRFLHGYFENYATDEGLTPEHWFWDRDKSGGIFIEHGVHFFDMFAGWLGEGAVESAQVSVRPGSKAEDQVQCAVRYGDGVMVNFYHGFTQVSRMDRQELRLLFERGDVTLHNWIPTAARIRAVADEADTRALCELFPGARLDVTENYGGDDRACMGRWKKLDVYQKIEMFHGMSDNKMHRYGELLRALMTDQLAWLRDKSHERRLTEENGRNSLALAVAADNLAHS